MESLFGRIRERTLREASSLQEEKRIIRGAWTLRIAFQPDPGERLFQYDVSILQVEEQGAAYSFAGEADHEHLKSLLGRDAAGCIPVTSSAAAVSALDALCGSLKQAPSASFDLRGSSRDKAAGRAGIILEEANIIARAAGRKSLKISNIGAIGSVVRALSEAGHSVTATDLEQDIIGTMLNGAEVLDGREHTLRAVAESDVSVVTGMTFANGALDEISRTARESGTKIILAAETGAWVGRRFIEEAGIETVVSEPFPYYIFSGISLVNVYRNR